MPGVEHDVHTLIALARIEARLSEIHGDIERLPRRVADAKRREEASERERERVEAEMEALRRERRTLEASLQDAEARLKTWRTQLMSVGSNREYAAMLKEIETVEGEIDATEEKLLEIMERLDAAEPGHRERLAAIEREREAAEADRRRIEAQMDALRDEASRLEADRPRLVAELEPTTRRRYERVVAHHGDRGVAWVREEHCTGCQTQLPPQVAVEVRKANQIITCQSCGRLLVAPPADA